MINEDQTLTEQAIELMVRFAARTGLSSERPQQRYLWTDAFAVCNFLGLARVTGEQRYIELALALVDRVHEVLGKHRPDDLRVGWLTGLPEQVGALHPTRGGLRIGKSLPERRADEPFDPQREWDRDGQYLHYLTRWMHALDQVARATGQTRFNVWARELADVAYRGFQQPSPRGGPPPLAWKMSIDLRRPLVPSMGQHDPLEWLAGGCEELFGALERRRFALLNLDRRQHNGVELDRRILLRELFQLRVQITGEVRDFVDHRVHLRRYFADDQYLV